MQLFRFSIFLPSHYPRRFARTAGRARRQLASESAAADGGRRGRHADPSLRVVSYREQGRRRRRRRRLRRRGGLAAPSRLNTFRDLEVPRLQSLVQTLDKVNWYRVNTMALC